MHTRSGWKSHFPPSHSCISRAWYGSAFKRLTNSSCDWAFIKMDVKLVCALAIKGGFKHPHVELWLPPRHLQLSLRRAGKFFSYFFRIFFGAFFSLWRFSRIFLWARPACPPQIMTCASGNTSRNPLAEEESASCQWTATCIPSSFAF